MLCDDDHHHNINRRYQHLVLSFLHVSCITQTQVFVDVVHRFEYKKAMISMKNVFF